MLQTGHRGAAEAAADFKTLRGGQAEHRFGQIGLQAVENGLAEAGGHAAHDAFDDATDAVALGADVFDQGDHFLRGDGIAGADDVRFDELGGEFSGRRHGRFDVLHRFDVGEAFVAGKGVLQHFASDGTGGDAADGLAGAGAAAAGDGADAVFGIVGVVGVAGAVGLLHLRVGGGALVRVAHEDADRHAERLAIEHAGLDFGHVVFFARRGDLALAGAAAVQLMLDVLDAERDFGRAAVHDDADAGAVGFTPGADAEKCAEVARHRRSCRSSGFKVQGSKLCERPAEG